jgi:hypothetical protein
MDPVSAPAVALPAVPCSRSTAADPMEGLFAVLEAPILAAGPDLVGQIPASAPTAGGKAVSAAGGDPPTSRH